MVSSEMGRPKINPVHIKLGAERRLDSDRPQRVDPPLSDRTMALPHRSQHFQPRFTELWEVIGWGVGGVVPDGCSEDGEWIFPAPPPPTPKPHN